MPRLLPTVALAATFATGIHAAAQTPEPRTPDTKSSTQIAAETKTVDPRLAPGKTGAPVKMPAHTTVTDAEGKPIAADPLLLLPPDSLVPVEVKRLQGVLGDYAGLQRYHDVNATLPAPEHGRVVFFGDSITDAWGRGANPVPFFPGKPYYNRGIGGQTTPQMLIRFQQDVVELKPAAVIILAGTNDIAGNTGLEAMEQIQENIRSMSAIADVNHIKVILSSVLPVDEYAWRHGLEPANKVRAINQWMQQFCKEHGYTYVDYYTALATEAGAMKPGTSKDGVHPTAEGYAIMAPLAQAGIDKALKAR
jgi:lysophospholipase L1-like esterase